MSLASVSTRIPASFFRAAFVAVLACSAPAPFAAPIQRHGAEIGNYNGDEDDAPAPASVARARLGLSVQTVDAALSDDLGLRTDKGALVTSVLPGGPGEEAGLKRGDVIVRVDEAAVRDADGLAAAFAHVKPGRETDLTLVRGIKTLELSVVPGRMSAPPPPRPAWGDDERGLPQNARLGLKVAEPDRWLRRRYGLLGAGEGIVVLNVAGGSRAEAAGIKEGDLIVEADRQGLKTTGDLLSAVSRGRKRGKLVLLVRRGEDVFYVPVRFE